MKVYVYMGIAYAAGIAILLFRLYRKVNKGDDW